MPPSRGPRELPPTYEEAILRDLDRFRHGLAVKVSKKDTLLAVATKLQRLRLVSVAPTSATTARVELTPAGDAALKGWKR